MAKKENREKLFLKCKECGEQNYLTFKNKKNTEEKIEIKKFCKKCNKSTLHSEKKVD